jgi:hypothetical protein
VGTFGPSHDKVLLVDICTWKATFSVDDGLYMSGKYQQFFFMFSRTCSPLTVFDLDSEVTVKCENGDFPAHAILQGECSFNIIVALLRFCMNFVENCSRTL